MPQMLRMRLLGDFTLARGDEPVSGVTTARLCSLLAYLALHRDTPQFRHHLAFLFWPDSSEAQARNNLRQTLHTLRAALGTTPRVCGRLRAGAGARQRG
jgi:DNA-binding SARP family transcriptional activator